MRLSSARVISDLPEHPSDAMSSRSQRRGCGGRSPPACTGWDRPGVDTPAHLFQTWLYRHQGFVWWNNDWYSGRYVFVAYSVLFYPLAAKVGIGALAVFAAAVMSAATALGDGRPLRVQGRARAGAAAGGGRRRYNMMVSGAYPFLCGAAAMAVALACVQRGWRLGFAAGGGGDAGLLAARAGAAGGGDGRRRVRRRHLVDARPPPASSWRRFVFVLALAATVQHLFSGDTSYPYGGVDLLVIGAFCVAGIPGGRHRQGGAVAAGHVRRSTWP